MEQPPALPHFSSQDDEYEGYRIPKNTSIIGNAWSVSKTLRVILALKLPKGHVS